MNNKKIGLGAVGIIVLIAVFYGGVSYGKSQIPTRTAGAFTRGAGALGANGVRGVGGFTSGSIIAKDATSITVQLMTPNGAAAGTPSGSKIIFLDSNTKISKQADGTLTDLGIGTNVSVTGTPNTDGSENAQSIQIRPQTPTK